VAGRKNGATPIFSATKIWLTVLFVHLRGNGCKTEDDDDDDDDEYTSLHGSVDCCNLEPCRGLRLFRI